MNELTPRAPGALRQFRSLCGLWWRHLRRRPLRAGEAPKVSGTPALLLIGALTSGYITVILWQNVVRHVRVERANFAWHAAGILLFGFGTGLIKGSVRLHVRGTRNDVFLEPLPLRPLARLGLRLIDSIALLPISMVGALAAHWVLGTLGAASVFAALLGAVAFVSCFCLGMATTSWVRALGPPSAGRWCNYAGMALTALAMSLLVVPLGRFWTIPFDSLPARFVRAWIGPGSALPLLYGAALALGALGMYGVITAERFGIDQLEPQIRAPRALAKTRDRVALERVMMLRQGGVPLLIFCSLLALAALGCVVGLAFLNVLPRGETLSQVLSIATVLVVYLAALQVISQARRAARDDQQARPFLASLPMAPHQVLEGKTRALRMLVSPMLLALVLLAVASCIAGDGWRGYRILITSIALFVIIEGAVSISFLSTGLGVIGLGVSQGTGFSNQLLLLPLFATALAPNAWAATTSLIGVAAVTFEARRAAHLNVRWLDDPADDVARETTVWRALLAAAAFFAMQGVSFQILLLFEMPHGYAMSLAFASASVLLALLTWRSLARIERPRFLPNSSGAWLLGALAGTASGLAAREFAKLVPAPLGLELPEFSAREHVALGVMMIVLAPLVEEYFFRGWLQRAIASDLPAGKQTWAFALGALAFALAHFGTYGVPQLVLGLLSGWLFAKYRGLWPCILAHALHNTVVLLLDL
ncbi:MAG TPA: CPBP family intramembrane glutamic endopeptidase [Polyangiales bacterium]|nr:CPBP family intramembrane glutamic endopeptidase [Polyangiales bacterium]